MRILGERVFHHRIEAFQLAPGWDNLLPNRAVGIIRIDEAGEIRGNIQAESVPGRDTFDFARRQIDNRGKFFEGVEAVA